MKQSINFRYDNTHSQDMGVFIAWNSGGLFEESFLPNRKIVEKKIANREKPYFQRVEHEPLSFSLSFAIEDWENPETLRKLARWFFQPYYKPLVFDSNPNRVFYAIFEGDSSVFYNGMGEGYVELTIRCDSPYSYSFEQAKENTEFRNSNLGASVRINSSNFASGILDNTVITSNGITVGNYPTTWGAVYISTTIWGGIT